MAAIPPIPYKSPFLSPDGSLAQPWAKWFRDVFQRVGGSDALSNVELNAAVTAAVASIATLSSTTSSLTSQIDGLNQGQNL
jgi:hypothetical protein